LPKVPRDGWSGSRTNDPPVESSRLNQGAITFFVRICLIIALIDIKPRTEFLAKNKQTRASH